MFDLVSGLHSAQPKDARPVEELFLWQPELTNGCPCLEMNPKINSLDFL